jgi:hypothetical protein
MRQPNVDDRVRLTQAIPELDLQAGDVGIVCSTWFAPTEAYEVEFGLPGPTRALLLAEQLQVEDRPNDIPATVH